MSDMKPCKDMGSYLCSGRQMIIFIIIWQHRQEYDSSSFDLVIFGEILMFCYDFASYIKS